MENEGYSITYKSHDPRSYVMGTLYEFILDTIRARYEIDSLGMFSGQELYQALQNLCDKAEMREKEEKVSFTVASSYIF